MKKINLEKLFSYGYLVLVTCIIPLITFNKYFDLTRSKGMSFIVGSVILIVVYLMASRSVSNSDKQNKSLVEEMCMILTAAAVISTLFARPITSAIWGDTGTFMGLFTYVVGIIALFILIRSHVDFTPLYKIIALINTVILGLNIIHALGIDIFGMHEGIANYQYYDYLGTIGNVNWIVGYISIMFVLALYQYLIDTTKYKYIYFTFLVVCCFNIHLIHSDAIYLSLVAAAIFLIPFILSNRTYAIKALLIVIVYVICGLAINLSPFNGIKKAMSGISAFMLNPIILITLLLITAALLVYIYKSKQVKFSWIIFSLELIVILALVGAVIDLAINYLNYNYYWGNNRLNTWINSLYYFKAYYTPMNRLFGAGPDMLYYVYEELSLQYGAILVNAHNCFIQVLMSLGVVGFTAFISLLASIVYEVLHNGLYGKPYFIYFVALVAFFAQSLVNNCNGNNIGLLIVVLALFIKKLNS